MALSWQLGDPKELRAICTPQQAHHLMPFDHHRAVVWERWAILITHHWLSAHATTPSLELRALLNPAPDHQAAEADVRAVVMKHPEAPAEIQALVDRLEFRAR